MNKRIGCTPKINSFAENRNDMYSKDEEKQLRLDFWGGLNAELELERGSHASKVNWMNFNTKIKPLYFRMEADENGARLCIDIQFLDKGIRELFYEQFTEFKDILNKRFDGNTKWQPEFEHSNGRTISRISMEEDKGSLYDREKWADMYVFLKENFIKLEEFWSEFGDVFLNLKS